MSKAKRYFLDKFHSAKINNNSAEMDRAFYDLKERNLLNPEEINYFNAQGYSISSKSEEEEFILNSVKNNSTGLLDLITIYMYNLLHTYELVTNRDFDNFRSIVDNLSAATNNANLEKHIISLKDNLKIFESLQNASISVLEGDKCFEREITVVDLIKCNTKTDIEDLKKVESFIEKVAFDPVIYKFLSLVAIFIAEGKQYNFKISSIHEAISSPAYLISNTDSFIFAHELYHSVQKLGFGGEDFYDTESQETFEAALENTYLKIIDHYDKGKSLTCYLEDLPTLIKVLKESFPEMKWLDFCHKTFQDKLTMDFYHSSDLSLGINFINYLFPFQVQNSAKVENIIDRINFECEMVKTYYNFSDHDIWFLGRVNYFSSCEDDSEDGSIVEDEECSNTSYRTEVLPSYFQMREQKIDNNILKLMDPMLAYVNAEVFPMIDNYARLHIENFCSPNPDGEEVLQDLIGKCLIDLKI